MSWPRIALWWDCMSSSRSAIKLINSDQGHWMPPQMTGPYLIDISLHAGNRWHRGSKENVAEKYSGQEKRNPSWKTCALCSQEILGWRGKGFEPCSESWSWRWSAQAAAAVELFSGRGGKSLGHPCGCKRFLELQLDLVDIECKNVKRFRMLILPIRWLRSASLS